MDEICPLPAQRGEGGAQRRMRGAVVEEITHGSRPRRNLQQRQHRHRFIARCSAHLPLRPQRGAEPRTLGQAEQSAAQLVVQLHAGDAGGFAVRHARNRRGDRGRDAAGAAARAAVHRRWRAGGGHGEDSFRNGGKPAGRQGRVTAEYDDRRRDPGHRMRDRSGATSTRPDSGCAYTPKAARRIVGTVVR